MDRDRIAAEIARRDLFRKPSTGEHPSSSQICARARNGSYLDRFECSKPGCIRIRLRNGRPEERVALESVEQKTPAGRKPGVALTENDVVDAVCSRLEEAGYEIVIRATTHQRGVDIKARNGDFQLLVEAKGGTSSKAGTNRFGKPFSAGQVTSHVSRAFYTAVALKTGGPEVRTALALPRTARHVRVAEPLLPSLRLLDVGLFWVDPDRDVELVAPWEL